MGLLAPATALLAEPPSAPRPYSSAATRPSETPAVPANTTPAPSVAAQSNSYPIDLPTALRLADANNPTVGIPRARVREAIARLDRARVAWIPNLTLGPSSSTTMASIRTARGSCSLSRTATSAAGTGPTINVDLSNALYLPLVARQGVRAANSLAQATNNNIQLEVAIAYLDLVELHGLKAINADMLSRNEQILKSALAGAKADRNKTAADVNRAERVQLASRRRNRLARSGGSGGGATRPLLPPRSIGRARSLRGRGRPRHHRSGRKHTRAVDPDGRQRPTRDDRGSVGTGRGRRAGASRRWPRFCRAFRASSSAAASVAARTTTSAHSRASTTRASRWSGTWKHLGWETRPRFAVEWPVRGRDPAAARNAAPSVSSQVVEAAEMAAARFATLETAQEAVRQAEEMYRKFREASFGMVGPKGQFERASNHSRRCKRSTRRGRSTSRR